MVSTKQKVLISVAVILVIFLIYALMPGIKAEDPMVGSISIPRWFIWYTLATNRSLMQFPSDVRKTHIIFIYAQKNGMLPPPPPP